MMRTDMGKLALAIGLLCFSGAVAAQTYSKTETTQYYDDTALWVLGQVQSTSTTGPAGTDVTSETTYGWMALPTQVKSFGKVVQTLTYDSTSAVSTAQLGTLKTIKDANNNVTTAGSWKLGLPQSTVFADNKTIAATINNYGWIESVDNESQSRTCYEYDLMGRLTRITYPSEQSILTCNTNDWLQTTQSFSKSAVARYGLPVGYWIQIVDTGAGRAVRHFDALWRPVLEETFDNTNSTTIAATKSMSVKRYDEEGRLAFQSYPVTSLTTIGDSTLKGNWTFYDGLGRVSASAQDSDVSPLTTLTEYLNNFKVKVTNPNGNSTTSSFMTYDEPGTDWPTLIEHPESAYTHITRDVYGKPTQIRRSDSISPTGGTLAVNRTYTYNAAQELCRTVEPETNATLNGYDAAGNLAWSAAGLPANTACEATGTSPTVAARKVSRQYDVRNRLTQLSFPDGVGNQTWTYTNEGRPSVVSVNNAAGADTASITYSYFRRGLLTQETQVTADTNWPFQYSYNSSGHLTGNTWQGLTVAYAPNALGQPTQAGTYATGVKYYPNGAIKEFTYGNGIVHTMTQNARQLPARSTDSGGGNPLDLAYSYDNNGNVTGTTDYTSGGRQTRSMTYDGLDRLRTAHSLMFGGVDNMARYSYDVLDNIDTLQINGRNHKYQYDASQRLTSVLDQPGLATSIGLSYDPQGNLANKNGRLYGFDYGNRLRSVSAFAGQPASTYAYDPLGRRVRDRTYADKYSLYTQGGQIVYEDNQRLAKRTHYIYLGGSLVARVTNSIAPATPVLTVPSFSASGSYTVSWTSVTGATGYTLEEALPGGSLAQVYSGSATSQAYSGKTTGTYRYRVRACLHEGCSAWSAESSIVVQTGVPTVSVPATAANGNYTVTWTAVSGATSYALDENANGAGWTSVSNSSALSRAYSSKPLGSYSYRVAACTTAGCGNTSPVATVQTVYPPATAPVLTAPANSYSGSYSVTWTAISGATSYRLEESANGGAWTQIQDAAGASAAISGRGAGSYAYRVRACNLAGCGGYSGTGTTAVTLAPTGVPTVTAPSTNVGGSYTVSWTTVSVATTYELEERVNSGAWTQVHSAAANSKALTGRVPATYTYRVRACNVGGCGGYSTIATTIVYGIPAVPTGLTGLKDEYPDTRPPEYNWSISWNAVPGADSYQLEQTRASVVTTAYSGPALGIVFNGTGLRSFRVRACNAAGCSAWSSSITP